MAFSAGVGCCMTKCWTVQISKCDRCHSQALHEQCEHSGPSYYLGYDIELDPEMKVTAIVKTR